MGYATVVGRFLAPAAPVAGNPTPMQGRVIFRPEMREAANGYTHLPAEVEATLENGYLSYGGSHGVRLMTPDDSTVPPWWEWVAILYLHTGGDIVRHEPVRFSLKSGETVDFAQIVTRGYEPPRQPAPLPADDGAPIRLHVTVGADGTAAITTHTE